MKPWQSITIVVVTFVCVVSLSFVVGRCSAPTPVGTIETSDPDAGFAEALYNDRMDAAVHAEDERLAELVRTHATEIEHLAEADRVEFETNRARGREALAVWFKNRSRALLIDGGVR